MTRPRCYAIDMSVRRVGSGTVLIGGSPLKLFRLTSAGALLIDRIESGAPITPSPATDALIDRLVDAGVLHPTFDEPNPPDAPFVGGVTVVIPEKSDAIARRQAKGSRGGRPLDFDTEDYKNRNVVERAFNKLKNWRGIATRYDKHALVYRGGVVLASILLWLS